MKVDQNLKNRRIACECASRMVGPDVALRNLHSWVVYFESYMGHGSEKTAKWMNIYDKPEVVPFKVVK